MVAIMNKDEIITIITKLKNVVAIRYEIFKDEVSYLFYLLATVGFLVLLAAIFGINVVFLFNTALVELVFNLVNNSALAIFFVMLFNMAILYFIKVSICKSLCKFKNTFVNLLDLEYEKHEKL